MGNHPLKKGWLEGSHGFFSHRFLVKLGINLCLFVPSFFFCWIFFSSFGTQRVLGFHYCFANFFSLPGLWRYGGRSLRPVWFGLCYLSHRRKLHGMCHGEIFFVGGEYFDTWTSNSSVLWLVLCVFCVLSNEHVKAKNVRNTLLPPRKRKKSNISPNKQQKLTQQSNPREVGKALSWTWSKRRVWPVQIDV